MSRDKKKDYIFVLDTILSCKTEEQLKSSSNVLSLCDMLHKEEIAKTILEAVLKIQSSKVLKKELNEVV